MSANIPSQAAKGAAAALFDKVRAHGYLPYELAEEAFASFECRPGGVSQDAFAAALPRSWTAFLDANPDGLTSPEELPDHALMTGEQFEEWAHDAFLTAKEIATSSVDPEWGDAGTVGNLIAQLRTLDPALPIYGAHHNINPGVSSGPARVKGLHISNERVIDGRTIDSKRTDVPYSIVAWTGANAASIEIDAAARDRARKAITDRYYAGGKVVQLTPVKPAELVDLVIAALTGEEPTRR